MSTFIPPFDDLCSSWHHCESSVIGATTSVARGTPALSLPFDLFGWNLTSLSSLLRSFDWVWTGRGTILLEEGLMGEGM